MHSVLEIAFVGGALGALAGTLGGLAFWRDTVSFSDHAPGSGPVKIGVNAQHERLEEAREVLRRTGGSNVGVSVNRPVLGVQRARRAFR
jgi:hypothetical protein